jgi:hypothetical protein
VRRALRYLASGLGALIGIVVVLLFFGLVNGGLVYRKQCPTAEGTVKTDWTYRWSAPLPYVLAPSEEGCEVHSGTRMALSSIGLWKVPQRTAADLERKYAASSRTDPGVAYISNVIAVMNDLRRATRERVSVKESFRVMRKGGDDLHALKPPAYLRADHQRMLGAYDRSLADDVLALELFRKGDRAGAQKWARSANAESAQFVLIAQRMQRVVLERRTRK